MCGIFAYSGENDNTAPIILSGLKKLEYRGYDSWGIAVKKTSKSDTRIKIKKRTGKIGNANVDDLPRSVIGIGHTRWATHGGVLKKNAHPHTDCSQQLAIIHNGIIENYDKLKRKLINKGHKFISDTDSEVAAHLIEELRKKTTIKEAVRKAFLSFKGLNAIIVLNANNDTIYAVRNGSPLVLGIGKNENFIASDVAALLEHTQKVYFMKDDELAQVSKDSILLFDAQKNKKKKIVTQNIQWKIQQAKKGNFSHYMIKEIHEQPKILSDIVNQDSTQSKKIAELIDKAFGTYMVGCGTAAYACLAGSYLFSKVAKKHINWAVGSEFTYHSDFLTQKSLVIALSQSGETIDTLEAVKKAKEKKATVLGLVNVLGSSLYRKADHKALIGAGPEKAVATTKAFTAKIAHIILWAYVLKGEIEKGKDVVRKTIKSSQKVLEPKSEKRIRRLANKIKSKNDIFIIGRGLSYPTSLEAALKIKEISYIHSEGFAAGELKHGVIALVEKNTPCIAFLPNDETYGENLSGAMEMKARGGYIIGISSKPHEVFDYFIPVEDAYEGTIIPNVITVQLLAYYLALARNLDPDMPRNLAKSVTVK